MCSCCINCETVVSYYFAIVLVLLYSLLLFYLCSVDLRFWDIECHSFLLENKSYIYFLPMFAFREQAIQ